jgi:Mg-chelatase subunit ChlD
MNAALDRLADHWLAAALLAVGFVASLVVALRRRRLGVWFIPLLALSAAPAVLAVGGLFLSKNWAWVLLATAGGLFFVLLLLLLVSGAWWRAPAYLVAGLTLLGLGGLLVGATGEGLVEAYRTLRTVEFLEPWWLLLLLCVPVIVAFSLRSLDLGEVWRRRRIESPRPWVSLGLRVALIVFITLALAEPRIRQPNENVTVLFVLDRSASIPEEPAPDPADPRRTIDRRAERIREFINRAVEQRGSGHTRDRAGLIVFGRRPRLELPPSDAPRFNLREMPAAVDGNYTDIGAALKLAMASFPEGTGKRVVLISDGNENLGSAEEQAREAKAAGVQIEVLPLAAGQKNEDEVLVERVDAPPVTEQGAQVPVRVLVRSFNPNYVVGKLSLKQITEGDVRLVGDPLLVRLRFGLNPFSFTRPLTDEQRSYTYEAEFQPLEVQDENSNVLQKGLPRDRVQNNRASAHVVARGQRKILILEGNRGDHQFLVDRLLEAGEKKFKVVAEPIGVLDRYKDREKLAVFLSNFDCVILANVPADLVSPEQQEVIRSNTHDQGCGLVMVGGPDGFGAGGWQDTPVEKALPVDSEIKSLKVQGKGGLVLIMHGCEMADGNVWEKKIAKLAIQRLGPADEIGVIDGNCNWHIKLQEIGDNREKLLSAVDKLIPGDMMSFDPALNMARDALVEPARGLSTKHVILISDGDPQQMDAQILPKMKRDKIKVATVGVATHTANEDKKMALIAKATGGNAYSVKKPSDLPAIYIKESRLVSQSFVYEKKFQPQLVFRSGPTDKLPDPLPPLGGFVRTTPKPSPLVELPILTPRFADMDFPLLAYWHYGLGKAVAFTSDAGNPKFWSKEWAEGGGGRGGVYARFWEQVIDWSLRPVESRRLDMATEYRDGKIRITVTARDDNNQPDVHLKLRGGITPPGGRPEEPGKKQELVFVQKNSGVYEVEVKAEEAGSYFITAQATRPVKVRGRDGVEHDDEEGVDSVRSGVTLPYSPEFADLESNTTLLERLREATGGQTYADDDAALAEATRSGEVFRPSLGRVKSLLPLWHWLLFLTGVLLFFDVAVRRLAVDGKALVEKAALAWARLRGLPVAPSGRPEFLERLQTRQEQLAAGGRAGRRFEGAPGSGGIAPMIADATAPPSATPPPGTRPAASQDVPPQPEAQPGDFASRLLRAKKKVWEERDKDKPE